MIKSKGTIVSVRITGIYVVIGVLWIILSDRVLLFLVSDIETFTRYQSYKGWFYVVTTAIFFFLFVKHQFHGIAKQNAKLADLNETLRTVQNRLQLTSQVANIGFWDWDLISKEVYYSPEWKAQLGFDDKLIGSSFMEWENRLHPLDKEEAIRLVNGYVNNPEGLLSLDFRLRHKDGTYRWILSRGSVLCDATGKPQRLVGVHLDITDRKRVEIKLAESENNYRLIFENNPYPMWVCDVNTLEFLAVNSAACSKYGYTKREFLSMTSNMIRPTEDLAPFIKDIIKPATAVEGRGVWQHVLKNGQVILVEISKQTISYFGREADLVLAHDVTDKIEAERALAQSEEKYRLLFDKSPYAIFIHTSESVQFANQAAMRLLKAEHLEQIVGKSISSFFGADTHSEINNRLRMLMEGETLGSPLISRIIDLSNNSLYVELISNLIGEADTKLVQTIVVDRTAEQQALVELRQSREQFAQFMDNFPGFAYIKSSDGRHLFANQMFKYLTSKDITGLRNVDIWPADMAKQLDANDSKVMSTGQPMTFVEDINRGGDMLTFLSMKFPLEAADGEKLVCGISIDITEQVNTNRKVKSLNLELEEIIASQQRSNEMEHNSIEVFLRVMDNRLKSPIRSISGYNKYLMESLAAKLTDDDKQMLQNVQQSITFLDILVDKLALYSRVAFKELHLRSVRIDSTVDAILRPIAEEIKSSGVTIKKSIDASDAVEADEECLSVALKCLLENALKYSKPNQPLVVEVGVFRTNAVTQIYVKDNGEGIAPELIPSLFDPFKRGVNPGQASLGLGLAIAQKAVQRLNGVILVKSVLNEGSTFTVEI